MSLRRFIMHYYDHIPKIQYEGSKSLNPFAFKYYDPKEMIFGKPMKDHLKFSLAYWHTLTGEGIDPFGKATMEREWDTITDPIERAKVRVKVAFELMEKLGMNIFVFMTATSPPNKKH